jgi:hypothetical protein
MLRFGYYAACLIIAIRTLEDTGHALESTSLLSTVASPTTNETPAKSGEESPIRRNTSKKEPNPTKLLRATCMYARQIVEIFIEMPRFVRDAASTTTCLCIGYCLLILAHHHASQSQVPDSIADDLLTRVDEWIRTTPGKLWSYKYGAIARRKLDARMGTTSRDSDLSNAHGPPHALPGSEQPSIPASDMGPTPVAGMRTSTDQNGNTIQTDDIFVPQPYDPGLSFDYNEQELFPSMEDFFGGRFLDFMK